MAPGRKDITLTVGLELARIDAQAKRVHDDLVRGASGAGRDAGQRFSSNYAGAVADSSGKISRAFDRVVDSISKVNEVTDKLNAQRDVTAATTDRLNAKEAEYNRALRDNANDTETLTRLHNELNEARIENNREMQKQISLFGQATRASQTHHSALEAVRKAQEAFAKDTGSSQGLLTLGKYISALRAAALPLGAVQAFSILTEIGAIAASASKSLLLLPGALTAVGSAIGTLNLGMVGFGDTIDQLVKGDLEKFAKHIQGLSPNAQQAALAIQALWPEFTKLKNATQDALFDGFGQRLVEMANQFLPTIEKLTTGIAGAFNQAGKTLVDQLMLPASQQQIAGIVNDITTAFNNLAPAVAPLTQAFLELTKAGTGVLPELASAASRAATAFATFIDEAAKSGNLDRWLREGLRTVGLLAEGVWNIGEAFMTLAPFGEKILPQIVRVLDEIKTIMPAIGVAAVMLGPSFGVWDITIRGAQKTIELFKTTVELTGKAIGTAMQVLGPAIDAALAPIRMTIDIINKSPVARFLAGGPLLGPLFSSSSPQIPQIPSSAAMGSSLYAASSLFGANAQPSGFGINPLAGAGVPGIGGMIGSPLPGMNQSGFMLPTAGISPYPTGGYAVPPPPADKGSGGKGKKDTPFFDPSLWSVDANPVTGTYGLAPGTQGSGAFPQWVYDLGARFGLTPSTYSGHQESNRNEPGFTPNPMGLNRGIDWSGPVENMQAFADYLKVIAPMMEQVIFQNPATGQRTGIAGGNFVGDAYYAGDWAGHANHVHTRQANQIPLPEQLAMMQGGGMGYMAIDQEAILRADNSLLQAKNDLEQKRLRLLEVEADGTSTQRELLTARNDVAEAENKYRMADLDAQQARQGKYKELDGKVRKGASELGAALADDFGLSEGLPGVAKWVATFLSNIAMAPAMGALQAQAAASPIQGGYGALGMFGAQNMAAGMSPLGFSQMGAPMGIPMGAPMGVSAIGPAPLGGGLGLPLPGAAVPITPGITPGVPGPGVTPGLATPNTPLVPSGGIGTGAGFPGMAGPGQGLIGAGRSATPNTSQAPVGAGGGGFQGIGGLPLAAMQLAGGAADLIAPGMGQAAQTGMAVLNRTAGYIGQLAAIGVGGLMETFLPNNSETADPSKSWIGRIASGLAGARPALPNTAGNSAPAQTPTPQQQGQAGQGGPMVQVGAINNYSPDGGTSIANRIGQMAAAGYASGGKR